MSNYNIFCMCLQNHHLQNIKKLGYLPVGLGAQDFSDEWIRDNTGENISYKNKYYGAAHGLVGILFVLLQAGEKYFIEDAMKNNVKGSIDYLRSKLYPSGNVPQSHSSNSDKLVRWCHGAPGAIHLFILASHSVKFGHFHINI